MTKEQLEEALERAGRLFCGHVDCDALATHRYTWPGSVEGFACDRHAAGVRRVSEAIGCPVEVIAL